VTLIVVVVPKVSGRFSLPSLYERLSGPPLAVTLALAFGTKWMTYEKLLVRVLGSCETMASTSVVCTVKTSTLTQNVTTVVAGSIGVHANVTSRRTRRGQMLTKKRARTRKRAGRIPCHQIHLECKNIWAILRWIKLVSTTSCPLSSAISAIAVNSTAFEDVNPESGLEWFYGFRVHPTIWP
jgi:Ca2+-transporting ATPase